MNAVMNENELAQSTAALSVILMDTLLLFYARPCKLNLNYAIGLLLEPTPA